MRVYASGLAIALGAAVFVYPLLSFDATGAVPAIGAVGLASLGAALLWKRARALAILAVILLTLHYAVAMHAAHVGLDVYSVLVAVGLFVLLESTDLSISLADVAPMTRPALSRGASTTMAVAAAGGLLALLGLLARSLLSAGIAGVIVGAISALGVVALALWLAQRAE